MLAMFYGALPPEINTGRLMAGAGPAPMLQAAAGWEALAISLETQAEELASSLSALSENWAGEASENAVASTIPMVMWLQTTAIQAQKRAMQAIAQATSYSTALSTTPQLPEIADNQITHIVLEATNFLGINTMPIGFNEADYARMWSQAAGVMESYQAETSLNTVFEQIMPAQPVVVPGVGESTAAAVMAETAASVPGGLARDLILAQVTGQGVFDNARALAGDAISAGTFAGDRAEGAAQIAQSHAQNAGNQQAKPEQAAQQGGQMMMQMASQVGSQVAQLPQQLGQLVTQPVQQLSQPLQQMTQIFTQLGSSFGSQNGPQIGLLGASPFSNHPLAGGSGASSGVGLVRAASLPGMGGTATRTPLMASLVGSTESAPA
ncbi:MAG: PPE family protein, partial [Mycobacterium sp.]